MNSTDTLLLYVVATNNLTMIKSNPLAEFTTTIYKLKLTNQLK